MNNLVKSPSRLNNKHATFMHNKKRKVICTTVVEIGLCFQTSFVIICKMDLRVQGFTKFKQLVNNY